MAEHTTAPPNPLVELWALGRAAQLTAATIAVREGADTDLRFTIAAGHCGEAADELERARPDIAGADLANLVADLDALPTPQASDALLVAIATALANFDLDDPQLLPMDLLAAGGAANWLAMAHHALSGRLP